MTAPKPGDRVRVTVVGNVVTGIGGAAVQIREGRHVFLDLVESVEVLASPVYVNSDTTEYRDGDVVVGDNESHVYMRVDGQWIGSGRGNWYEDNVMRRCRQVRLLVRDGQVVQ